MRFGKDLADRPEVWDLEAYYIAVAVTNYIMILSPQKVILGGGVMHQTQLMQRIRAYVKDMVAGYLVTKELEDLDTYITLPSLDDNQGILGALKLGMDELALK